MEVLNFINSALGAAMQYMSDRPLYFMIAVIFVLACIVGTLYLSWIQASELMDKLTRIFYMIFMSIACVFLSPITFVFLLAEDILVAEPEIISNQFLIEAIVIVVLYTLLEAVAMWINLKRKTQTQDKEKVAKIHGTIIYGAICVGATLVFIFTDAELILPDWGFSLFGKTLGQWVLNTYLAAIFLSLMGFARDIIQIIFIGIFGNPFAHIKEFLNDE
jgi:hypothetical protein